MSTETAFILEKNWQSDLSKILDARDFWFNHQEGIIELRSEIDNCHFCQAEFNESVQDAIVGGLSRCNTYLINSDLLGYKSKNKYHSWFIYPGMDRYEIEQTLFRISKMFASPVELTILAYADFGVINDEKIPTLTVTADKWHFRSSSSCQREILVDFVDTWITRQTKNKPHKLTMSVPTLDNTQIADFFKVFNQRFNPYTSQRTEEDIEFYRTLITTGTDLTIGTNVIDQFKISMIVGEPGIFQLFFDRQVETIKMLRQCFPGVTISFTLEEITEKNIPPRVYITEMIKNIREFSREETDQFDTTKQSTFAKLMKRIFQNVELYYGRTDQLCELIQIAVIHDVCYLLTEDYFPISTASAQGWYITKRFPMKND